MNNKEKINQLRKLIYSNLNPLINNKCLLLDAPYYHNIGDVLIWAGEECFLKNNGISCLYTASYETCTFPKIDTNTTIIFNGGGNLGDIYHEHIEFLIHISKVYPKNRIIVCPQTVFYQDNAILETDFSQLALHNDLYFCARDGHVFKMVSNFFREKTLLVPDMAFCIDNDILTKYIKPTTKSKLIIARNDVEKSINNRISDHGDISDWPVIEHSFRDTTFINKLFKKVADSKIPLITNLSNRIWNNYAPLFKNMMIKEGVEFISPYKEIETTRLHGCILSILLDKNIILCDNSYGKNRNFYNTWLNDIDTLSLKK